MHLLEESLVTMCLTAAALAQSWHSATSLHRCRCRSERKFILNEGLWEEKKMEIISLQSALMRRHLITNLPNKMNWIYIVLWFTIRFVESQTWRMRRHEWRASIFSHLVDWNIFFSTWTHLITNSRKGSLSDRYNDSDTLWVWFSP